MDSTTLNIWTQLQLFIKRLFGIAFQPAFDCVSKVCLTWKNTKLMCFKCFQMILMCWCQKLKHNLKTNYIDAFSTKMTRSTKHVICKHWLNINGQNNVYIYKCAIVSVYVYSCGRFHDVYIIQYKVVNITSLVDMMILVILICKDRRKNQASCRQRYRV